MDKETMIKNISSNIEMFTTVRDGLDMTSIHFREKGERIIDNSIEAGIKLMNWGEILKRVAIEITEELVTMEEVRKSL